MMMEDKQLNFNQPFLTVRRHSPAVNSAKDDKRRASNFFLTTPRLPPHKSELKSGPVSNPGVVPFLWEQTPGQPKGEREPETPYFDRPPIIPKLPPGRNPKASQQDSRKHLHGPSGDVFNGFKTSSLLDEGAGNLEGGKEKTEESSESDDDCDAFTDARDTLSRTESFFLNCSMSGLSEMDDDSEANLKSSRDLSMNSKSRELMMDRFLPAAKAMTSEAPKYANKKQHAVQEPQQLKKILGQHHPSLRYGPSYADRYSHCHSADEESDDEFDESENFSAVCGLLPRFCLKSSLCLLNPVPTMSVRSRLPISTANKLRHSSSSSGSGSGSGSGSYSETENESKSDISEPRSVGRAAEFKATKSRLRNEQSHLHSHKKSLSFDTPMPTTEEKEVVSVPLETKKTGIKGVGLHRNVCKTFGDFLAETESPNEAEPECPVVERTLYVDIVHKMESPSKQLSPRTQVTKMMMERMNSVYSSPEDFNTVYSTDADASLPQTADKFTATSDSLNKESETEMPLTFGDTHDSKLHSPAAEEVQATEEETTKVSSNALAEKETMKSSPKTVTVTEPHISQHEFPAPPPLPNSPSDSWLSRTLPSAARKNLWRRSSLGEHQDAQHHLYSMSNGK